MRTRIETLDYWIYDNDIIEFKAEFNELLDKYYDIISQYNKLKFSNYTDLITFRYSMFNKPINNLPNNIIHLTFGWKFNQQQSST